MKFLLIFGVAALVSAPFAHATGTGQPYTPGGLIVAHMYWQGGCARWIYAGGQADVICDANEGRAVFHGTPGDTIGVHLDPTSDVAFASCEMVDQQSGNLLAVDAGWTATCVITLN